MYMIYVNVHVCVCGYLYTCDYHCFAPKSRPLNMQPTCQGVPKGAQNWRVALFFHHDVRAMETAQRWQGAVHLLGEV